MVDPNSILVFDLKPPKMRLLQVHAMHEFDLRQFKQAPGIYYLRKRSPFRAAPAS